MIYGIGVDIVCIERMSANLARFGNKFAQKILTTSEFRQFQQRGCQGSAFLASRFAVKEAFVKALGTGMRAGLRLSMIGTKTDDWGKPYLDLHGLALTALATKKIAHHHLSISDEREYAVAMVILEL